MLKRTLLLTAVLFSFCGHAQTNYEQFKKLQNDGDTVKMKRLLTGWEKQAPIDAEFYVSAINYYFLIARKETLSLENKPQDSSPFEIKDSTGAVKGFINISNWYDAGNILKAISYAETGIGKFPDRLDIRFGKCYLLSEIGDYENFTNELVKTIDYSRVNHNNWLWTGNKKQENGERFLLENVHTYLRQLYDTENDNLLPSMIQIGEAAIKYYPAQVPVLSITSVAYLLTGNYDRGIELLKQAEKTAPEDFIVLNNIARAYEMKGDKPNAVKYYELTEKYGDEQAKRDAAKKIRQLKN